MNSESPKWKTLVAVLALLHAQCVGTVVVADDSVQVAGGDAAILAESADSIEDVAVSGNETSRRMLDAAALRFRNISQQTEELEKEFVAALELTLKRLERFPENDTVIAPSPNSGKFAAEKSSSVTAGIRAKSADISATPKTVIPACPEVAGVNIVASPDPAPLSATLIELAAMRRQVTELEARIQKLESKLFCRPRCR